MTHKLLFKTSRITIVSPSTRQIWHWTNRTAGGIRYSLATSFRESLFFFPFRLSVQQKYMNTLKGLKTRQRIVSNADYNRLYFSCSQISYSRQKEAEPFRGTCQRVWSLHPKSSYQIILVSQSYSFSKLFVIFLADQKNKAD